MKGHCGSSLTNVPIIILLLSISMNKLISLSTLITLPLFHYWWYCPYVGNEYWCFKSSVPHIHAMYICTSPLDPSTLSLLASSANLCKQFEPRSRYNRIIWQQRHQRGAQWLSSRVLDWRPRGQGFKAHRRHCVVVLEQDTFILS